jgi:hypothetical protein
MMKSCDAENRQFHRERMKDEKRRGAHLIDEVGTADRATAEESVKESLVLSLDGKISENEDREGNG